MERTEQQKPQEKQEQPQKDREQQKKPRAQENEREDTSVGKVPDPQGEDAERDRKDS